MGLVAKGTEGYKVRTITCIQCGTVVTKRMPAGRKYCSLACYRSAPKPQRRSGATVTCVTCGGSFYVNRRRLGDNPRFCSNECHTVYQGRNKTDHVCKTCGAAFRWSPSRARANRILYCSLACRDADPDRRAMLLELNTRQQSKRTTQAERLGYALLDRMGVEHERQRVFAGKFTPDALIPQARLVVQFDGDYWHDRKGTSAEARIRRRVDLDRSQDAYIRASGWEVVRLWASDLESDPDGCAEKISQFLHRPLGVAPARDPLALA